MAVWDCFTFNNELVVLEARLHELDAVVDHFVLVEAALTHAGEAKPLVFAENRHRFGPWQRKIIHVVTDLAIDADDAWVRENAQRRAILDGLDGAAPDDLVLVSDADEIPSASLVERLADLREPTGAQTPMFYYRFNLLVDDEPSTRARAARRADIADPEELRFREVPLISDEAGWHFSYLGDAINVEDKLASFAHREVSTKGFATPTHVRRAMRLGIDYYRGRILRVVPDEMLPAWVQTQRADRPELFARGRGRLRMPLAWPYALATRQREALGPERMDRHPVLASIRAVGRHVAAAIRVRVRRLRGRAAPSDS